MRICVRRGGHWEKAEAADDTIYAVTEGGAPEITGVKAEGDTLILIGTTGNIPDKVKASDVVFTVSGASWSNVYGGINSIKNIGNAENNSITITGDAVVYNVYGGYTNNSAKAENNTAVISGGTVNGVVYGGYSFNGGAANLNRGIISGGTVNGDIYGGYARTDSANKNQVIISGTADINSSTIYGGYSEAANNTVDGNSVTIEGGTFTGAKVIYGGWTKGYGSGFGETNGIAQNNTVTVKDGTFNHKVNIYGGYSGYGIASGNKAVISGGKVGNVYGGSSHSYASGNSVNISGGIIGDGSDFVYGGSSNNLAEKNEVNVSGGSITIKGLYGGYSNNSSVKNNVVNISDGSVTGSGRDGSDGLGGGHAGTYGTAEGNVVNISGGTFKDINIYGAYSTYAASNNAVNISGGSFTDVDVYGGYSSNRPATNNTVTIANGTVNGSVYGGKGNPTPTSPMANTITLGDINDTNGHANIKLNVYPNINTAGSPILGGGTVNVYNTGNMIGRYLSVIPSSEMSATLNFYINAADMDATGSKTMLTVEKEAQVNGTTIYAGVRNVGSVKAGDKITLLQAGTAGKLTVNEFTTYNTMSSDGIMKVDLDFKLYEGDREVPIPTTGMLTNGKLIAIAKNDGTPDNSPDSAAKSPVETMAASVSLINAGADMMAGEAMTGAAQSTAISAAEGSASTLAPFAAVGGSKTRVESGSHVDLKSWNVAVGFAKEVENKQGKLMFGPVVEYGRGSYDSYLDNGTHGDGTSSFLGIGVMAKQTNKDGLYYEGSLRGGRAKSDYSSNFTGVDNVNYDTSAAYYAMHLGVGKVVKLDDKDSLDCYGKLFYSHQAGDRAHLSNGYDYDFKAVDSIRTRLGVRYTHKINDKSSIYTGLAWQHEFDSKAKATIISGGTSFDAPSPSIKGDTGIFELGWKIKPGKGNFETGLGLTGSVGKQRGIGLNAQFQWMF